MSLIVNASLKEDLDRIKSNRGKRLEGHSEGETSFHRISSDPHEVEKLLDEIRRRRTERKLFGENTILPAQDASSLLDLIDITDTLTTSTPTQQDATRLPQPPAPAISAPKPIHLPIPFKLPAPPKSSTNSPNNKESSDSSDDTTTSIPSRLPHYKRPPRPKRKPPTIKPNGQPIAPVQPVDDFVAQIRRAALNRIRGWGIAGAKGPSWAKVSTGKFAPTTPQKQENIANAPPKEGSPYTESKSVPQGAQETQAPPPTTTSTLFVPPAPPLKAASDSGNSKEKQPLQQSPNRVTHTNSSVVPPAPAQSGQDEASTSSEQSSESELQNNKNMNLRSKSVEKQRSERGEKHKYPRSQSVERMPRNHTKHYDDRREMRSRYKATDHQHEDPYIEHPRHRSHRHSSRREERWHSDESEEERDYSPRRPRDHLGPSRRSARYHGDHYGHYYADVHEHSFFAPPEYYGSPKQPSTHQQGMIFARHHSARDYYVPRRALHETSQEPLSERYMYVNARMYEPRSNIDQYRLTSSRLKKFHADFFPSSDRLKELAYIHAQQTVLDTSLAMKYPYHLSPSPLPAPKLPGPVNPPTRRIPFPVAKVNKPAYVDYSYQQDDDDIPDSISQLGSEESPKEYYLPRQLHNPPPTNQTTSTYHLPPFIQKPPVNNFPTTPIQESPVFLSDDMLEHLAATSAAPYTPPAALISSPPQITSPPPISTPLQHASTQTHNQLQSQNLLDQPQLQTLTSPSPSQPSAIPLLIPSPSTHFATSPTQSFGTLMHPSVPTSPTRETITLATTAMPRLSQDQVIISLLVSGAKLKRLRRKGTLQSCYFKVTPDLRSIRYSESKSSERLGSVSFDDIRAINVAQPSDKLKEYFSKEDGGEKAFLTINIVTDTNLEIVFADIEDRRLWAKGLTMLWRRSKDAEAEERRLQQVTEGGTSSSNNNNNNITYESDGRDAAYKSGGEEIEVVNDTQHEDQSPSKSRRKWGRLSSPFSLFKKSPKR